MLKCPIRCLSCINAQSLFDAQRTCPASAITSHCSLRAFAWVSVSPQSVVGNILGVLNFGIWFWSDFLRSCFDSLLWMIYIHYRIIETFYSMALLYGHWPTYPSKPFLSICCRYTLVQLLDRLVFYESHIQGYLLILKSIIIYSIYLFLVHKSRPFTCYHLCEIHLIYLSKLFD